MEIRKFKRFGKQQEFVCLLNKEMDSLVDDYAKRRIADLEAKLLKFAHRISDQNEEILELKQQLAEKDQAIEGLQEINKSLGQTCNNDAKEIERLRKQIVELEEQDVVYHNQTAIAELEKVKNNALELHKQFCQSTEYHRNRHLVGRRFIEYYPLIALIDQQIKELKGEK